MRRIALSLFAFGTLAVAAAAQTPQPAATPTQRTSVLPGTLTNPRPDAFATIQGNALSSSNDVLPDMTVRLRDARTGHIIGTQTTDKAGLFEFAGIDPGNYVVELVASDESQKLLAATQLITANAGDSITTILKLPFRIPPFGGLLGDTGPSAAAVVSQAAAAGVLATEVAGTPASER